MANAGAHTHTRGTMDITGGKCWNAPYQGKPTGAFALDSGQCNARGGGEWYQILNFKASRAWTGATSNNGAHTHTVTLNKSSIYGNSETVQPASLKVRVKARAK